MAGEEWFISAGGGSVTDFSSFLGFQYANESSVPEKAVEEGSFFSANKWDNPYDVVVDLAKHGEASDIGAFIDALEQYRGSTDLVSIVTPAKVFINGNIYGISFSWNNDETGPRMLVAKVAIKEIRPPGGSQSSGGRGGGGASSIGNASNGECNSSTSCGRLQGESVAPAVMAL